MTAVPPGREPQNLVSPQENPWITLLLRILGDHKDEKKTERCVKQQGGFLLNENKKQEDEAKM